MLPAPPYMRHVIQRVVTHRFLSYSFYLVAGDILRETGVKFVMDVTCGRASLRVTRYPISISRMTISILSSAISISYVPYR